MPIDRPLNSTRKGPDLRPNKPNHDGWRKKPLYAEASAILLRDGSTKSTSSLKSHIFSPTAPLSNPPKQVYALCIEVTKCSAFLSRVIEQSGLLEREKTVEPVLALLAVYDLCIGKNASARGDKKLRAAVERQKDRIAKAYASTLRHTELELRGGKQAIYDFGKIEGSDDDGTEGWRHPRWVRINTLKTDLDTQLKSTFNEYGKEDDLRVILRASPTRKAYYIDETIPNLIALPPGADIAKTEAYRKGEIILQDKASCFPAYLLLGDEQPQRDIGDGDILDACAAPGNKTTHAAALLHGCLKSAPPSAANPKKRKRGADSGRERTVFAIERDKTRSLTLEKMCTLAIGKEHSSIATVKPGQDFTRINPHDSEYANITGIILDPSCSGSGIVGRDEEDNSLKLVLPRTKAEMRQSSSNKGAGREQSNGKATVGDPAKDETLQSRLTRLSNFQVTLLKHAMSFPACKRITYSTCSIHYAENEGVVLEALFSASAYGKDGDRKGGWRILRRDEQPPGLKEWDVRGIARPEEERRRQGEEVAVVLEGCIRCEKGTEQGTMGFFVACFVRDDENYTSVTSSRSLRSRDMALSNGHNEMGDDSIDGLTDEVIEEEWLGFADDGDDSTLSSVAEAEAVEDSHNNLDDVANVEQQWAGLQEQQQEEDNEARVKEIDRSVANRQKETREKRSRALKGVAKRQKETREKVLQSFKGRNVRAEKKSKKKVAYDDRP